MLVALDSLMTDLWKVALAITDEKASLSTSSISNYNELLGVRGRLRKTGCGR